MLSRFPHCSWYINTQTLNVTYEGPAQVWLLTCCHTSPYSSHSVFPGFPECKHHAPSWLWASCRWLLVCAMWLSNFTSRQLFILQLSLQKSRREAFLDPPEEINCLLQALTVPIHFFQSNHHGLVLCICEIIKGILSPLDCQVQWGQGAVSFTYCLSLETSIASGTSRIKFLAKETKRALHINF